MCRRSTASPTRGRLIDLDLDGDLDLLSWSVDYSSFEPQPLRAWRNGGGGQFTDATAAHITPPGAALEAYIELAAADFDGDGRDDLLGADYGADLPPYPGGQPRLLMRRPDGGLTDETTSRLPVVRLGSFRALTGDLDGAGDVDACLPQYRSAAPAVLLNDGAGHLALADGRLPDATSVGYTQGAVLDADGDGDLDLYLGYQGHINANSADIGRDHLLTLEAVRPLDIATWGDLSLGMAPGEIDVGTGAARRARVVVMRGGFPGPIALEAAADAPGLSVSLTDAELSGDEPAELVVTAAANAPRGSAACGSPRARATPSTSPSCSCTSIAPSASGRGAAAGRDVEKRGRPTRAGK
jgi:hypothetical protein